MSKPTHLTPRELATVAGASLLLPDPTGLIHLQFRRFAGCPICDLHLRSFARRHDELVAAGVREIAVFHSTTEALREHAADRLPFAVLADPHKQLYRELGVESAPRALLDPRVWLTIVRAIAASLWLVVRGQRKLVAPDARGGRLGLPADFLIASDGRILASKYGAHAYDQWSVDEVLEYSAATQRARDSAARSRRWCPARAVR